MKVDVFAVYTEITERDIRDRTLVVIDLLRATTTMITAIKNGAKKIILGLGGSMLYNGGPHQYTERQMNWRINKLRLKLRMAGAVDIVLTHAPVRGYGDQDNLTHRGFEAFIPLMDKYRPSYLVHGHVHQRYGAMQPKVFQYKDTTIINACGKFLLDLDAPPSPSPAR